MNTHYMVNKGDHVRIVEGPISGCVGTLVEIRGRN